MDELGWSMTWYQRLAVDKVAKEEGKPVPEVTKRFVQLVKLFALEPKELESVYMADLVRLAANAPDNITLRMMRLKAILPNTDLSLLVPHCPQLLRAETDLAEVKARLDAAGACIEGVPRDVLEGFMVARPRVFLTGETVPKDAFASTSGEHPQYDGSLVCKVCREARRLFGCSSDSDALQKMVQSPDLVAQLLPA
jgi:hypothetical protein